MSSGRLEWEHRCKVEGRDRRPKPLELSDKQIETLTKYPHSRAAIDIMFRFKRSLARRQD